MAPMLYDGLPQYPPVLSESQESAILSDVNDFALANGLAVRPSAKFVSREYDPHGVLGVTAPVTLFPSRFPRGCYEQARAVAPEYNELYARIAADEEWLGTIMTDCDPEGGPTRVQSEPSTQVTGFFSSFTQHLLGNGVDVSFPRLVKVDDFMEALWKVHLRVKAEGYVQDKTLGLFRSDYMVHVDTSTGDAQPEARQVEFNTIASSFGGLSSRVADVHRYLVDFDAYPTGLKLDADKDMPKSHAVDGLARGMAMADQAYAADLPQQATPKRCVLFVIQGGEQNVFDQRHIEYALHANYKVLSFRVAFRDVLRDTRVQQDKDRRLIYTPPTKPETSYEVSVVYFRTTYTPAQFEDEQAWEARYQLERSAAIKCPSILLHLAGSKKVQQVLATPDSPDLARFLPDPTAAAAVRRTFAAIYPLDDSPAGRKAKELALKPETARGFVLKPQREGGGNNVYREKIPPFLRSLGDDEQKWAGHILMEIIEPPAQQNVIMREGKLYRGDVIVELGVYGAAVWRRGQDGVGTNAGQSNVEMLHSAEAGYLLRTKASDSEEGGVAAGFGSVDSLLLVDV